jgi:hypothetical protein
MARKKMDSRIREPIYVQRWPWALGTEPCTARSALRDAAGKQAQVDFDRFEVEFVDEPRVKRIVWLFSMVLSYSELIWARFVFHQDCKASCVATSLPSRRSAARRARPSTMHEDLGRVSRPRARATGRSLRSG